MLKYIQMVLPGETRTDREDTAVSSTIRTQKGTLHEREFSQGYVRTTNNRMELMAAIVGMEALTKPCEVELYSDSKYLVDAFNQHWIDGWLKRAGNGEKMNRLRMWIYGNGS